MMRRATLVLLAVAKELSELAKNSMPALRKGETIQREWFKNATYYRETNFGGQRYIAEFNFPKRRSQRILIEGGNVNA